MTEELLLWRLERELAKQEMILSLAPAEQFNQVKQKLDSITDAIEALRVAGFAPFAGLGGTLN